MSNTEGFSYQRLIKLLGKTTSSNDAEALSFMRAANRELDRLGKTWHEFVMSKITVVADPFDRVATPPRQEAHDYGLASGVRATAPRRPPAAPPSPPPRRPRPNAAAPHPFATTSGRPAAAPQPTRISNRFAGLCTKCRERVGPGEGEAYLDGKFASGKDRWSVEHTPGTCPQKMKLAPVRGTMDDLDDMIQDVRLHP